jgi:ribosomal-protein-alanine N-acetyltransferase
LEWRERSVSPSNLVVLGRLEAMIVESEDNGWGPDAAAAAIAVAGARIRLAERNDGVGIGFVLARRIVDVLEIDLAGVQTRYRRAGIARAMLSNLIGAEVAKGLVEARLELAESNQPARELYKGLGFVVVGRRTRYYPDGDDALLLSRRVVSGRSVPPP